MLKCYCRADGAARVQNARTALTTAGEFYPESIAAPPPIEVWTKIHLLLLKWIRERLEWTEGAVGEKPMSVQNRTRPEGGVLFAKTRGGYFLSFFFSSFFSSALGNSMGAVALSWEITASVISFSLLV